MRRLLVATVLLLASASAYAQEEEEAAPLSQVSPEDRNRVQLNEVEHGFFLGVETGLQIYVKPPGSSVGFDSSGNAAAVNPGAALGQTAGIELGFEPTPLFTIGAVVWGGSVSTPSTYFGTADYTTNSSPHGNFATLLVGADARLNLSLGEDTNGVRRLYFYVRAGGGYSIVRPEGLLANEVMLFGGPGIEYFTRLRHFSIGAEADGSFGLGNKGIAVVIQPVVRYNF